MAREVWLANSRFLVDGAHLFGQGGEAEVYDLRPLGRQAALKLWKPPDHVDYEGSDDQAKRNRITAKLRLEEAALKLAQFPKGLPDRVIGPMELAKNRSDAVIGYTMQLLDGTRQLRELGQRSVRDTSGITNEMVIQIFMDLYNTVQALHKAGVVIGDFNYLNVLVKGLMAYIIDADSMQYGQFTCRGFTTLFVDPAICDPKADTMLQVGKHSAESDWYAFSVMLFECLMFIKLFGGVYNPKDKAKKVSPELRPLAGISVFNPEVIYPKQATPLSYLPSKAIDYYGNLTDPAKRARGEFPRELLEILLATAQGKYVDPATVVTPTMVQEVIRGAVRSKKVFDMTNQAIVRAALHNRRLKVLAWDSGALKREDGRTILSTPLNPQLRYRVQGDKTLIAMGQKLAVFSPGVAQPEVLSVDLFQGKYPVFDSNAEYYYWLNNGMLYRNDPLGGQRFLGNVLQNQTQFWVGPTFGLGFYRGVSESNGKSSSFTMGFVFDAKSGALNDRVQLPQIRGELLDAVTYFSSNRAWLCTQTMENGKVMNRCVAVAADGSVSNQHVAEDGDGSWLSTIHAKCATTVAGSKKDLVHRLFAATGNGLVAIDDIGGTLTESTQYPDTAAFVDESNQLIWDYQGGVYVISRKEIWQVTFT